MVEKLILVVRMNCVTYHSHKLYGNNDNYQNVNNFLIYEYM